MVRPLAGSWFPRRLSGRPLMNDGVAVVTAQPEQAALDDLSSDEVAALLAQELSDSLGS